MPLTRGMPWYPPMVDRDSRTGKVTRLWATAYIEDHHRPVWSQSYLRQSVDGGRTWSELVKVPEWSATNEVNLIRAKNGDIVAALRTDIPVDLRDGAIDHSEGLGISISKDEGRSWSKVNKLYNWGRHHSHLFE